MFLYRRRVTGREYRHVRLGRSTMSPYAAAPISDTSSAGKANAGIIRIFKICVEICFFSTSV